MKRLLIAYMLLPFTALGQANAGPDKMVSDNIPATLGVPGDGKSCYSWKAFPDDPSMSDPMQPQIVVKPKVPTVYRLTVIGEDFSARFEDEALVTPLTIEYFRLKPGEEWKVVVGMPIQYSARGAEGCTNWQWKLGSWVTSGGASPQGSDFMVPEETKKLKNAEYGDADGRVEVSCIDASGQRHVAAAPVKAFVFFQKDVNFFQTPLALVPNWFHFWVQVMPRMQIGEVKFGRVLSAGDGRYAETNAVDRIVTFGMNSAGQDHNFPDASGIRTFWVTWVHENKHQLLWDQRWPAPGGYDPAKDTDQDLYPDAWERDNPEAREYGFHENDGTDIYDDKNENNPAFKFEEDYCFWAESQVNRYQYDDQDWSYDPTGAIQGKQWLKIKVAPPSPNGLKMNSPIAKHP